MEQNHKQEQVQLHKTMELDQLELNQEKQELKQQIQVLDRVKKTMYTRISEFNKEQQEIIKKLDDIEELKKANYKNYLEGFDEEFETHTQDRFKETPLLMRMFNEFVEHIFKPSNIYWIAAKTKNMIKEDLQNTLDDREQDLLEQLQLCEDRILDDMTEQAFIYGYAIAMQSREESINQYPSRKEDN